MFQLIGVSNVSARASHADNRARIQFQRDERLTLERCTIIILIFSRKYHFIQAI